MTRQFRVIGHPIAHSLSPVIHSHWIKAHGLDAAYTAEDVAPDQLQAYLSRAMDEGMGGLNITLPHKEKALQSAASASDVARRIGAANTLVRKEGTGWHAENTDAPGFTHTLSLHGLDVAGRKVCLLGAGGSARAVALALANVRAELTICNRTIERAKKLAADIGIAATVTSLDSAAAEMAEAELVVNTISLGQAQSVLDFPPGKGRAFYDISYGKAVAPLLAAAKTAGWGVIDGLGMLVAQAAFSFEHWFGILPEMDEIHAECRKIVERRA